MTPTTPPGPTVGELDAIRARYSAWYNDAPDDASWPGRDDDESMANYIVRQHVRDLLDAAEVAAPTAGVDREALARQMNDTEGVLWSETDEQWQEICRSHADVALALLATARAGGGGVTVTTERVRDHIDAYEELAGQCVSVEDLRALGIEVQR